MELNQYLPVIEHFKLSLNIFKNNRLPYLYPATFTNLASCYSASGMLDSVSFYAVKGIELAHAQNNYSVESNGWFILGTEYMEQKNYNESLQCFLKAKPIREKTGNYFFIVSDMAVIGELYALMGNTDAGIKISKDALLVAQKQNLQAKYPMI